MFRSGRPFHADIAAAVAAVAVGATLLGQPAPARASEDPGAPGADGGADDAVQASFFAGRGTSPALGAQVYPSSYFADTQAVTALDMVRRLPGFTLDPGSNVRGLSGSAGNVLIDGQRPFTKSETVESVLRRIPAWEVERIDVSQGEAAAGDGQGQLVLANVIRVRTAAVGGAVSLETTVANGLLSPSLRVEGNRRAGPLSLEGSASAYFSHGRNDGGAYRLTDAAGALLRSGDTVTRSGDDGATLSAQMRRELSGDATLRIGASVNRQSGDSRVRTAFALPADGAPAGYEESRYPFRNSGGEVTADYEGSLGAHTKLRAGALATRGRSRDSGLYTDGFDEYVSANRSQYGETLARVSAEHIFSPRLTLEGGAEAAINVLRATSDFLVNGDDFDLPSQRVRVEEPRGEVQFRATWKPAPKLSLATGAIVEVSAIRQTGDISKRRSFAYPKPSLLATYAADRKMDLRLRIDRQVSQLDFTDFVTSAAVETQVIDAGNPNLEPQRTWRIQPAVERRFARRGAAVLTYTHEEIDDAIDLLPIARTYDAPGNIGPARRDVINAGLTVPFELVGVSGGLLKTDLVWRWSQVQDPVTGALRRISGEAPFTGTIAYTHDLPGLGATFGASATLGSRVDRFRLHEISSSRTDARLSAYVDYRFARQLQLHVQADAGVGETERRRALFGGPRDEGVLIGFEERRTPRDASLSVQLRRGL